MTLRLDLWKPFKGFDVFYDDFDRFFGEAGKTLARRGLGDIEGSWTPRVDIYEEDNNYVMKAELPGVKKEDIKVDIKDNVLILKAEKKFEKKVEKENYISLERNYGTYTRNFTLPENMDTDHIKASFKDGVLELTLPKREEIKPREIKVN